MLFAILAVGADRPGIVAAVTGALADAGADLDDTSMTILHGHFAIAMVVHAPTEAVVREALDPVGERLALTIDVRPIADGTPASPAGERWVASVTGADRPGIVAAIAGALADAGANVVDLTTRVVGEPGRTAYVMSVEVVLPGGVDGAEVEGRLKAAAEPLGVDVSLHAADADIL